ncbi:MAG: glycosyltransferase family 4 protein [Desulfobacterales bacterium]|nr:glycosyltransferase family 4 protein [Pseudomonadota bacterium]MBU4356357.1 glycosyltransferase family 4 protein [Pseudomonadota bacterium]MCG2771682.1 glycosyltransferase family 4 protein [Desulfobacterales bacterium]
MKILHLLSQRPEATGSGIYIQAMIRESARRGHENFLLAGVPQGEGPQPDGLGAAACEFVRFEGGDLPFPVVGMSDVMPYPSRRFSDLSPPEVEAYEWGFADRLLDVVARFQPQVIHSHHLWLVTAVARQMLPHLPLVATCHGSDLRQFHFCPHLRPRVLAGCRELDGIMALSGAQKHDIIRLYDIPGDRIEVVGAGYNEAWFRPRPKPAPDPVRLVYAGKLSRAKGVPWLLRALEGLRRLPWRLDLIGGGSGRERDEILELAAALEDRVHVWGPQSQEDLARLMGQAHLVVLPSFFEGLPLVVLEALASGCRVVTTALPGVVEVLGGYDTEAILMVPRPRLLGQDTPHPEDEAGFVRDLAGALERQILAARERPEVDRQAVAELLDYYSWPQVFARVEQVYLRALDHEPH